MWLFKKRKRFEETPIIETSNNILLPFNEEMYRRIKADALKEIRENSSQEISSKESNFNSELFKKVKRLENQLTILGVAIVIANVALWIVFSKLSPNVREFVRCVLLPTGFACLAWALILPYLFWRLRKTKN